MKDAIIFILDVAKYVMTFGFVCGAVVLVWEDVADAFVDLGVLLFVRRNKR